MAKKRKKKATKKVRVMGIVASIIMLVMCASIFGVLEAPLYETTTTILGNTTTSTKTAYDFLEEKSKKVTTLDENNQKVEVMQIEVDKKLANDYKETILKNASSEATQAGYDAMMHPIKVYDSLIATMAVAAVGALCSLLALIFGLIKKNKLAKIFNILGILSLLAIIATGAIAFVSANAIATSPLMSFGHTITKTIVPIIIILIGAVGTLAGGITTMLSKK